MKKLLFAMVIAGSLVACSGTSAKEQATKDSLKQDSIAKVKKDSIAAVVEKARQDSITVAVEKAKTDSIVAADKKGGKKKAAKK
jgi:uncharacterized lipoprotein